MYLPQCACWEMKRSGQWSPKVRAMHWEPKCQTLLWYEALPESECLLINLNIYMYIIGIRSEQETELSQLILIVILCLVHWVQSLMLSGIPVFINIRLSKTVDPVSFTNGDKVSEDDLRWLALCQHTELCVPVASQPVCQLLCSAAHGFYRFLPSVCY